MNSLLRSKWMGILLVAFLYFLTGRLGQIVAIPPGHVTAIWPPSAISLIALLLYGYQLWPGVLLGSFLNNWLLSPVPSSILISAVIGSGAAIQAVFGAWLIQRFIGVANIFNNAYTAVLFLILGALSCLVNSNIGTAALYFGGIIPSGHYLKTWWTWWLGDSGSIFVLAPLCLEWRELSRKYLTIKSLICAIAILMLLYVTIQLAFHMRYPVIYLVIPVIIWSVFEFGLKGATLTVFITSALTLWYTAQSQGPFILPTTNESLLFLETFLATLSMTGIIIGVVLKERHKAFDLLEQANAGLGVKVNERTFELEQRNAELSQTVQQLKSAQHQIVVQERLATFGSLSAGVVSEIKDPLNYVNNFADINLDLCNQIDTKLSNEISKQELKEDIQCLKSNMDKIQKHGKKIEKFLDCLLVHIRGTRGEPQVLDLNYVIKEYSLLAYTVAIKELSFSAKMTTHFDETLDKIEIVPQDFTNVLLSLLNNANYSILQKKKEKGELYSPEIIITTQNFDDRVEIKVHDNGIGIPMKIRDKIFEPFFSTKSSGEGAGLGLTLCRDIIVIGYGGQIKMDSQEGEFADFTIVLPKKQ